MNAKWIKFFSGIIGSTTLIVLGIFLIIEANIALPFIRYVFIIVLGILIIMRLISLFARKNKYKEQLLFIIIYSIILVLLINFPDTYISFVGLIVGIYAIINSIINFIDYYLDRKNHLNGILGKLFKAIIYFFFGLLLIFIPNKSTALIFVIGGIYLIILGSFNFTSAIKEAFGHKFNVAVSLPVILSAILPARIFLKIKGNKEVLSSLDDNPYDDEIAPLEIFIYVQESGFESFGHCDISFNGTIYSYGLHDPKDRKIFGSAGGGVLVRAPRNEFLDNCLKSGKTMIFDFVASLSDEEMNQIKERIDILMKDAIPFNCDAKIQELNGEEMTADDYISDVYKDTKCDLFKFKRGKFKTYFVFTTNCVELIDYLIRNQEIDLLKMSGIVSPGTYFNFLYQLFLKPDSIIKKLKIYKKKSL